MTDEIEVLKIERTRELVDELETLRAQVKHLTEQRDDLQRRGTELVETNRNLRIQVAAQSSVLAKQTCACGSRIARPDTRAPDVAAFFAVANQRLGASPHIPRDEEIRFRVELNVEECFELIEASFDASEWNNPLGVYPNPDVFTPGNWLKWLKNQLIDHIRVGFHVQVDLPKAIDALADIDYVSEGFRLACGVDGYPIWQGVHAANMRKKGGPKDPVTGKHLKPAGWKPFDVRAELARQGWVELSR